MSGRDWRDMAPADFDADAAPAPLFTLAPEHVAADDGYGTGDLLAELG